MIVVFGSINIDLVTRVAALPAPGETVLGPSYDTIPGGKGANQALAARRAGGEVALVGAVGQDGFADVALQLLLRDGVDCTHVARVAAPTGAAFITVDAHSENIIVVASGANGYARAAQVTLKASDILLLQREVPDSEGEAAARKARASGAKVMLNLAPAGAISRDYLAHIDILVMNEHEAGVLAEAHGLDARSPELAALALHQSFGLTTIVTLGAEGAVAFECSTRHAVAALAISPVDTTAAGDTFVGALAACLARGQSLSEALPFAAAAGSLACTVRGAQTSIPYRNAILAQLG